MTKVACIGETEQEKRDRVNEETVIEDCVTLIENPEVDKLYQRFVGEQKSIFAYVKKLDKMMKIVMKGNPDVEECDEEYKSFYSYLDCQIFDLEEALEYFEDEAYNEAHRRGSNEEFYVCKDNLESLRFHRNYRIKFLVDKSFQEIANDYIEYAENDTLFTFNLSILEKARKRN